MDSQIKESIFRHTASIRRRKDMLPHWITACCWVFLVLGFAFFLAYPIAALLPIPGKMFGYTIDIRDLFNLIGIVAATDTILKTLAAYGLLKEKDWAVKLAIIQGSLALAISLFKFSSYSFAVTGESVGELLANIIIVIVIIVYLVVLFKIKGEWEANIFVRQAMLSAKE